MVRHFTIQFTRLSNLESCPQKVFPFATTAKETTQKSADLYLKMECHRRKEVFAFALDAFAERECLFYDIERKRRLATATWRKLVRKLILKMQVGV